MPHSFPHTTSNNSTETCPEQVCHAEGHKSSLRGHASSHTRRCRTCRDNDDDGTPFVGKSSHSFIMLSFRMKCSQYWRRLGTASRVPGTLQSSVLDGNQVQNHIHNICMRAHSSSSFKGQFSPSQHSQVLMRKSAISYFSNSYLIGREDQREGK